MANIHPDKSAVLRIIFSLILINGRELISIYDSSISGISRNKNPKQLEDKNLIARI